MSKSKVRTPFLQTIKETELAQTQHHANFYRGRHVFVPFTNWVPILTLNSVSDTGWTAENVSAEVSADAFAIVLLAFFLDTASSTVNTFAKFRGNGSTSDGTAYIHGGHLNSHWRSQQFVIPIDDNKIFEYNIEASGANTATLHLYLVGYYSKIT